MKNLLIIFIFSTFTFNCNTNSEYEFEKSILNCFYLDYEHSDIDIKSKIYEAENVLIKYKILDNTNSDGFMKFISQIADSNGFPLEISDELIHELRTVNLPSSIMCTDSNFVLDSSAFNQSKIKDLLEIYTNIYKTGNISQEIIGNELLTILSEKDFNQEFYKVLGIITISNYILLTGNDTGLSRLLPNIDTSNTPIDERNILVVYLNENNEIFVNDKLTELDNLGEIVKEFLLNPENKPNLSEKYLLNIEDYGLFEVSEGVISFQNDRGTSYQHYISVQNEIVAVFNELRDEMSLKIFQKEYSDLSSSNQSIIKEIVPLAISEREPKD